MPIGSGIVYNTGDLILSQVSSSGTAFLETKIAAATSSLIYFDSTARINSASLNSITVGTASYVSGSTSIITNLTASNISASGRIIASVISSSNAYFSDIGFTNQTVAPDTSVFPTGSTSDGLILDGGTYTNGLYRTRFVKVDRSSNLPLYIQETTSTSGSFRNLARFGTHANSPNTFEVFGSTNIQGAITSSNFVGPHIGNTTGTSSWSTNALTASFLPVGTYNITSSWAINASTASYVSPSGNAFVQGGNSFGTTATLGTNDASALIFETNGTGRVTIDTNGNVGIGTTTPNNKLHVYNSAGSSTTASNAIAVFEQSGNAGIQVCVPDASEAGLFFSRNGAAYYSAIARNGTDLTLKNNSTTAVTINSSGNVGIGTTSPLERITFGSSDSIIARSSGTTFNSGYCSRILFNQGGTGYGYLGFYTYEGGSGGGERMRIAENGNVGIGTTVPGAKLQVVGTANVIELVQATTGSATYYVMDNTVETGGRRYRFGYSGASADKGSFTIYNATDNITPLTITTSGSVGIGSTSPGAKLQVAGNISGSSFTSSISNAVGFLGTSSWAQNVVSASFATNALTASSLVAANSYTITNLTASGVVRAAQIAEKVVTFTPLTGSITGAPAWYRIISGSGVLDSGRVRLSANYDNSRSDIEFTYAVRNYDTDGAGAFINITRASTYNSLFNAVRVIETGNLAEPYAIDVLIGNYLNNTTPGPVTCLYESQFIGAVLNTPTFVSASATGSNIVKTVYTTYTSGYPRIGPTYSDGLAVATTQGQLTVGYRGNYAYNTPSTLNYALLVSGSVGIGTTSPGALLDVSYGDYQSAGTVRIGADLGANTSRTNVSRKWGLITGYNYTNASAAIPIIGYDSANTYTAINIGGGTSSIPASPTYISFFTTSSLSTYGAERVRIISDGNVGIGTTVPVAKLQVAGNVSGSSFTSSISNAVGFLGTSSWAQNVVSASFATTAQTANALNASNTYSIAGLTSAYVDVTGAGTIPTTGIYRPSAKTLGLSADGTLIFKISNVSSPATSSIETGNFVVQSGNVGLGTNSPNNKLDIWGGTGTTFNMANDSDSGRGGKLTFISSSATGRQFYVGTNSSIYNLVFGIDSIEKMRLDTSGYFAINTTNTTPYSSLFPGQLVVDAGTSNVDGIFSSTNNTNAAELILTKKNPTNNFGSLLIQHSGSSGDAIALNYNVNTSTGVGGTNSFKVTTDGTGYFRGNVGIGTTGPSYKLDVSGSAIRSFTSAGTAEPGFIVDYPNSNGYGAFFIHVNGTRRWRIGSVGDTNTEPSLNFWQEGTGSRMIIGSNGNVGIGTSVPAGNLDIYSTDNASEYVRSSVSAIRLLAYGDGTNWIQSGTSTSNSSADLIFSSMNGVNQWMRIQGSTGNVGIGTTSPGTLLNVHGINPFVRINNTSTSDQGIKISYNNSDTHGLHLIYNPNYAVSYIDNTYPTSSGQVFGDIYFRQNVAGTMTTRMTIKADGGGNVGIGTSSPGSKLQINDNTPVLTIRANDGGTSRKAYIDFYTTFFNYPSDVGARRTSTIVTGFDSGVWGTEFLAFNVGSGSSNDAALLPIERVRIDGSGNVGIGTSSPAQKLEVQSGSVLIRGDGTALFGTYYASAGENTFFTLHSGSGNTFHIGNDVSGTNYTTMVFTAATDSTGGKVGIGTTVPVAKLQVAGNISGSSFTSSISNAVGFLGTSSWAQNVVSASFATTAQTANALNASNTYSIAGLTSAYVDVNGSATIPSTGIYRPSSKTLGLSADSTLILKINGSVSPYVTSIESGNVGIGSSNPTSKFEVLTSAVGLANQPNIIGNFRGDTDGRSLIRVDNTSTSAGAAALQAGISFVAYSNVSSQPSANKHEAQIILGSTGATSVTGGQTGTLQIVAPQDIAFNVSASNTIMTGSNYTTFGYNAMYIARSGNVGIGTVTPAAKLEISGSSNSALLNIKSPISGAILYVSGSGAVGIGTSNVGAFTLQVSGSFGATTKSFIIDHPTKAGKKLMYGSLESPYHGIRLTGRDTLVNGKCKVELPDYMYKLILHDSINIQLTGIKCNKTLYVDDINIPENYFTIAYDKAIFESYKDYDFFWDFTAIRADVPELTTEL